jgi:hypothetical protein
MNKMGSITVFPVDWDKRPKIVPPASKTDKIIEAIVLIGVLLSVIIVFISAVNLSDIIPGRYNPLGDLNTYLSQWPLLAIISFLAIIIYVIFTVLNRYPYTFNYYGMIVTEENAPRLYSIGRSALLYIKLAFVWMILILELFLISLINNPEQSPLLGFFLILGLFHVVLVIIAVYAIIKISQEYKPNTR